MRREEGDAVRSGISPQVLETPGHTLDHVSYVFDSEKALFAADTLFSIGAAGCSRHYPQMWDRCSSCALLPDDFKLYAAMKYTAQRQIRAYRRAG